MLLDRLINVFRLRAAAFSGLDGEKRIVPVSLLVMVVVALANGVRQIAGGTAVISGSNLLWLLLFVSLMIVNWVVFAFVVSKVAAIRYQSKIDFAVMISVIGLAQTPLILGIVPVIGRFIGIIWTLLALYVGLMEVLEIEKHEKLAVMGFSWIAFVFGALFLSVFIG